MTITIRPARMEDVDAAQEVMNNAKNIVWLGGFVMKEQLAQRIRKQEETGEPTLLVTEDDGKIVGTSEVTPKAAMMGMGLVAVDPEYKRRGIASAMYTAHVFRAVLEGRCILVDKIRDGNESMMGMLPHLGFSPTSVRRQNSRNHVNLDYWEFDLRGGLAVIRWMGVHTALALGGFKFDIVNADSYEKTYERLYHEYFTNLTNNTYADVDDNRALLVNHLREINE